LLGDATTEKKEREKEKSEEGSAERTFLEWSVVLSAHGY